MVGEPADVRPVERFGEAGVVHGDDVEWPAEAAFHVLERVRCVR